MRVFGFVMFWTLLLPLSGIWYGYVLSILWAWFMVPAFHLPSLSIALAIGISTTVRMVTSYSQPSDSKDKDKEKKSAGERSLDAAIYGFLPPLVTLAFGAIIHLFV